MFYQDIKLIHVTFYRCFDKLLGHELLIVFLKFYASVYLKCTTEYVVSVCSDEITAF